MSDVRRSTPLPTEERPASVLREQKQKDLLTDTCFFCCEGFSILPSSPQEVSMYTTCCFQPCHFQCLDQCMQHKPSCPVCRKPLYKTPSTTPVDSPLTAVARFGLAHQVSDLDSDPVAYTASEGRCHTCHAWTRRVWPGTGQYQGSHFCEDCWRVWERRREEVIIIDDDMNER